MHCCRILLDRTALHSAGHPPCHSLLPVEYGSPDLTVRIVRCSMQDECTGCSVIAIHDPTDSVPVGTFSYEAGRSSVMRIRAGQYLALVENRTCLLARLVGESGCVLSTAFPRTDTMIEWTLVGPDSAGVHRLLDRMREEGYDFEFLSAGTRMGEPLLSAKQDLYLTAAWEAGYYDVPKRIGLDELASSLGVSKSTLNVALRTAERNIIGYFISARGLEDDGLRPEHVRDAG